MGAGESVGRRRAVRVPVRCLRFRGSASRLAADEDCRDPIVSLIHATRETKWGLFFLSLSGSFSAFQIQYSPAARRRTPRAPGAGVTRVQGAARRAPPAPPPRSARLSRSRRVPASHAPGSSSGPTAPGGEVGADVTRCGQRQACVLHSRHCRRVVVAVGVLPAAKCQYTSAQARAHHGELSCPALIRPRLSRPPPS